MVGKLKKFIFKIVKIWVLYVGFLGLGYYFMFRVIVCEVVFKKYIREYEYV